MGRTLADEAGKLLDHAKDLKNAIDRTLKQLKLNYGPAEIEEEFGSDEQEFIDDFTNGFLEDIELLEKYCNKVIGDCNTRKANLDRAIIWG